MSAQTTIKRLRELNAALKVENDEYYHTFNFLERRIEHDKSMTPLDVAKAVEYVFTQKEIAEHEAEFYKAENRFYLIFALVAYTLSSFMLAIQLANMLIK